MRIYNIILLSLHLFFLLFQIHMDPFEEIGTAEKNAEQHRRSANEKEVRIFVYQQ